MSANTSPQRTKCTLAALLALTAPVAAATITAAPANAGVIIQPTPNECVTRNDFLTFTGIDGSRVCYAFAGDSSQDNRDVALYHVTQVWSGHNVGDFTFNCPNGHADQQFFTEDQHFFLEDCTVTRIAMWR